MSLVRQSIEKLKDLLTDENCFRMNHSNIKGYLGELLVKEKLESEGKQVIHLGNQSGFDLEIKGGAKIDVKFSILKPKPDNHWGWTLKSKSKKKPITCTHFICVAVNNEFEPIVFYVITKENLSLFPRADGRFIIDNGFCVMEDGKEYPDDIFFQTCKSLIAKGQAIKVLPNENLSDKLN